MSFAKIDWPHIKDTFINGNRTYAREKLLALKKKDLLSIVLEAIQGSESKLLEEILTGIK